MGKGQSKSSKKAAEQQMPDDGNKDAEDQNQSPVKDEDSLSNETNQNKLQGTDEILIQLKTKWDKEKFVILLIGFIGSGKSSFIESLKTISENSITTYLPKGAGGTSITACATEIVFKEENELLQNISILDIAGLQEAEKKHGLWINGDKTCDHIGNLIEGNIGDGYLYTGAKMNDIEVDVASKKQALVFVCKASEAEHRLEQKLKDESMGSNMEQMLLRIRGYGLSPVVVLTACDEISEKVSNDPSVILRSSRVDQARKCAAKLYEVNLGSVYPVINYTDQNVMEPNLHPPLLFALFKIVSTAHCYIKRKDMHKEDVV